MFSGKRLICLLTLGILVFSILAVATVSADAPYEIKWYFPCNGPQRDVQMVEAAVNEFLVPKINATLKLNELDFGTYGTKLPIMLTTGEPVDVCFIASWSNPAYRVAAANGYLTDITDLWAKYGPKSKAQLPSGFVLGTQIEGRNYAIPCNKEMAHQWGFMYRTDIAKKYGFDMTKIKKFTDIEPMLKVIKQKEPGLIPLQNVKGETGYKFLDYDRIVGDNIPCVLNNDSKDMKIFNELTTPEAKAYFDAVRKWYQAGYIPADAPTVANFSDARRAGKIFAYCGSLKPLVGAEVTASLGFPMDAVAITKPIVQTRDVCGSMMAIPKACKDPETAMKFLELLNTNAYLMNLVLYGIEGKHYEKVNLNQITFPAGVTRQNDPYRPGNGWVFGNQFIQYVYDNENPDKWAAFKAWNLTAGNAKSLGFNFVDDNVKTEVAACSSVWDQYMTPLTCGSADPKTALPLAIQKFKAAGIDKIIAEAQKQLDAWLKNKK